MSNEYPNTISDNCTKAEGKFVTIIIPCRNEEKFIGACLDSILANDYPKNQLEILIVDGESNDNTQAVIARYLQQHPFIKLLVNHKKITPAALNIGIKNAQGNIILRMDAHNVYPSIYISGLVHWLIKSGADNVGGIWNTQPANDSMIARGIALAISHPFGVGNTHYRIGTTEPKWVDTVPFGCYRRDVFDRIGVFDEELIRNQDDEFNLRLIKNGGRILLVPDISSDYYARGTLSKLWRMYYQYGYFKPLVIKKIGGVMTFRHMVPTILVLTLIVTAGLAPWSGLAGILFSLASSVYGLAVLASSLFIAGKHDLKLMTVFPVIFPCIHFAFGCGFLRGMIAMLSRSHKASGRNTSAVPITR